MARILFHRQLKPLVWLLLAGAVVTLLGLTFAVYAYPYLEARRFPESAEKIVSEFASNPAPQRDDYVRLAAYFAEGFTSYARPSFSTARYPGFPSLADSSAQDLEGFSRVAPLLAAWLKNSRDGLLRLPSGTELNVAETLRTAFISGTDPMSEGYWGNIADYDQRIVEASDVALALWLSKDKVWKTLSSIQQDTIGNWLRGVNGKQTVDNNWHLFVAQVNVALQALGQPFSSDEIASRLQRTRQFYAGKGWFRDGPNGTFDYYNAWGFHYQLGWLYQMNPELVQDIVSDASPPFSEHLLHLIGPRGFPIFGRSICYRLAVTSPLLLSLQVPGVQVTPGEARRALDATWQYFALNGAIKQGRVTQGYCDDDPALLDAYSGPASCLWSLRSLTVALSLPESSTLWTTAATSLPIERASYQMPLGDTGLVVIGDSATGDISVLSSDRTTGSSPELLPYSFKARAIDFVLGGVRRPSNDDAKYLQGEYSSEEPFCGCSP